MYVRMYAFHVLSVTEYVLKNHQTVNYFRKIEKLNYENKVQCFFSSLLNFWLFRYWTFIDTLIVLVTYNSCTLYYENLFFRPMRASISRKIIKISIEQRSSIPLVEKNKGNQKFFSQTEKINIRGIKYSLHRMKNINVFFHASMNEE